jgi:ATP-dependent DNA helicase 2 subunit 1
MCYLYPSEEVVDPATDRQLQPPGFFLIYLPFADDIRQNPPDVTATPAPSSLVDRMRAIVKQLHMPKAYVPEKYENPSLQWHYRILQAIALDEEVPENPVDRTLPNYKAINKHAGQLVLEWGEELETSVPERHVQVLPEKKKGTKRAKEEEDGAAAAPPKAKKAKADATGGGDVRAMWEKGQLGKCTVATLKEFMTGVGLPVTGKKADLMERCEKYFEKD